MLQLSFALCLSAYASGKRVTLTAVNKLRLEEVMTPALSAAGRFSVLSGIQQVHEITHITHRFLSQ